MVYSRTMLRRTRSDGTLLRDLPHYAQILPYILPKRTDATIFYEQDFDVTHMLEYLRGVNERREGPLGFFHVVLCAAVRMFALRPQLNRFVAGCRIYQRNEILISFTVKKVLTDDGQDIVITIPFRPDETLATLAPRVNKIVRSAKRGASVQSDDVIVLLTKLPPLALRAAVGVLSGLDGEGLLPQSFLRTMPFWSSVFIADVGSLGIDAPLHHPFNIGTCGLFTAVGRIRKEPVHTSGGSGDERHLVRATFTFDERIADGVYCARSIELLRDLVEHPERLAVPPELTPDVRAELMLKE
jgi:hypothetical protein